MTIRHRRRLSAAERDLWRRAMGDVRPLRPQADPEPEPRAFLEPRKSAEPEVPAAVRRMRTWRPLPEPTRPVADAEGLQPGSMVGIDKRTAQRLRRGRLPVEGRLDLHGHTQDTGYRALCAFVAASFEAGRRCVLIVTGKGLRPDGRGGVLRANVPRWLNQAPNRERVLAITQANQKDGGGGAFYVLLRRKR